MTVFIDTTVIMYAGGREHPLKAVCTRIIDRVAAGELEAVISAEVIQEILHRHISRRQSEVGTVMAMHAMDVFSPIVPVSEDIMRRAVALAPIHPHVPARDLVHVATCLEEGIARIVTPDTDFDGFAEIVRVTPEAIA